VVVLEQEGIQWNRTLSSIEGERDVLGSIMDGQLLPFITKPRGSCFSRPRHVRMEQQGLLWRRYYLGDDSI
jgi:hypothetical protein